MLKNFVLSNYIQTSAARLISVPVNSAINALLADDSTFPIELPLALVAIILVHLGVTLFDRFHPNAKDIRGITYDGRKHQADATNDILLEERSLRHHAGHSGKNTCNIIISYSV